MVDETIIERETLYVVNIIVELLKDLYLELGEEAKLITFLTINFDLDILRSGNTEIYLAKIDNDHVVAILTFTENQDIYAGGKYGSLDEMFIKHANRSLFIGKLFIKKLKTIGKERNWKRIDVTAPTEEKWKRTIAFYEKCGFVLKVSN